MQLPHCRDVSTFIKDYESPVAVDSHRVDIDRFLSHHVAGEFRHIKSWERPLLASCLSRSPDSSSYAIINLCIIFILEMQEGQFNVYTELSGR